MTKTISVIEIAEKIQAHYSRRLWDRPLYIYKCYDCYETIGSVYFSLEGSPPKGFAVYLPGHELLSFYDIRGRRWKILRNIRTIEGLDSLKDIDVLTPEEQK